MLDSGVRRFRLIIAFLLLVYLPSAAIFFKSAPDAVEYLSLARNIAAGNGFVSDIKYHHFNNLQAIHHARGERPPLFPVAAAPVLKIIDDPRSLQVFNLVLFCAALCFFYSAVKRFAGSETAFFSVFLIVVNPLSIWLNTSAFTESLTLLLTGALLCLLSRTATKSGTSTRLILLFFSGVLSGLLILTRNANVALVPGTIVAAVLAGERGSRRLLQVSAVICGLFLVLAAAGHGSTAATPSVGLNHYRVKRFDEAAAFSYLWTSPPDTLLFIKENIRFVLAKISRRTVSYGLWIILLLAPVSAISARSLFRGRIRKATDGSRKHPRAGDSPGIPGTVILSWAVMSYILAASTWAVYDPRLVYLPVILLTIPVARFAVESGSGRIIRFQCRLFAVISLVFSGFLILTGLKFPVEEGSLATWLDRENVHGCIASNAPWKAHFVSGCPTVMLPPLEAGGSLDGFIEEFGVDAVVVHVDPKGRHLDKDARGAAKIAKDAHRLMNALENGTGDGYLERDGWRAWFPALKSNGE